MEVSKVTTPNQRSALSSDELMRVTSLFSLLIQIDQRSKRKGKEDGQKDK